MMHHTFGLCDDMWWPLSWSFLVLIAFSSFVLGLSAQMHIDVLFSSEQASCQLSRHSCLFHQPLMKLEHCGICSSPISHLHQVYFAGYCFTFSNSCMVRKTCGTLRTFTSAREPLLILFRGRRQGRQPLNIYISSLSLSSSYSPTPSSPSFWPVAVAGVFIPYRSWLENISV